MRMIFKSVKLKNFMSYENAELTLDRHGYVLVSGVNNNPLDGAKSNGTGKSSLFSAITWALTGLTISGSKEVANIYLDGTTSVELSFSVDGVEYVVIRTKNPSNLKIYVGGENKSGKGIRDTEKILSEILPDVTYMLLSSVIILGQGLPQKFTNNTPSGRKEVLEKLSNSDFMIVDLKNRVSARGAYLKSELRKNEDATTDLSARIDVTRSQIERSKSDLSQYTADKLEALQQSVKIQTANKDAMCKDAVTFTQKIENEEQALSELSDKMLDATARYDEALANAVLTDTTELSDTISNLSAEISSLDREIKRLDSVTDVCPTCGQKLPDVHKIDTTEKKLELVSLKEKLLVCKENKQKITKENEEILESVRNSFSEEQTTLSEAYKEKNQSLLALRREKSALDTQIKDCDLQIQSLQMQIDGFEARISELQDQILDFEVKINDYKDKIMYYNGLVDRLNEHLDINSKMTTILSRDFRGYLLSGVIDYVSKQAKQYASDLFGTDMLEFLLDGNNIVITYDNKEYEVLSGGEKQKVDVIVQLAIRDMLCSFLNFSSNILVLDEITDNLDIVGCQKMFNLISTKLNDVESVYIISHHKDDFEIPYDDEIHIVKGVDRISRIVAA